MVAVSMLYGQTDTNTDIVRALSSRTDTQMVYVDDGTSTATSWWDSTYYISCRDYNYDLEVFPILTKRIPFYEGCFKRKKNQMFKDTKWPSKWATSKPKVRM